MQSLQPGSQLTKAEPLAEIPAGVEGVNCELNELQQLLGALHQRLETIMPACLPECDSKLSSVAPEPSTQLGQQLAEHARRVRQANSSVRNLLDRIKL